MKALFELFRRFDARRIFGFIRRLLGMSRPKVKCYDLLSNHALRVEGDHQHSTRIRPRCNFYPRPPGGGRPVTLTDGVINVTFLSTPSGWRATISTITDLRIYRNFYPRPPGGGRRFCLDIGVLISNFYPRPPGGGRQQKRTKFSSVFAKKGEEFASLRRGKRKICRWRFKKDKFWVLIWCEGSRKSVCALASHCG